MKKVYTQMGSKVEVCQEDALNLNQAKPAPKQLNLKSLAMQADSNSAAVRRGQAPTFEPICVYYPNGALYASGSEYYYEEGHLKTVEPRLNGELHGEVILYWPNGQVKRKCSFVNGRRVGWDRMWSEEGQLLDEEFYEPR